MKEIILDSNIIIRLLIRDIEQQYKKSYEIFHKIEEGKIKANISILVINEIIWILEHFYELERKTYIPQLQKLIALKNIRTMECKKMILMGILEKMMSSKIDFTDLYLLTLADKKQIVSFDKDLNK